MKNLLIALLLLSPLSAADVLSQSYEATGINVLAGDTVPFTVEQFDPALGTLTDVRVIFDEVGMSATMYMRNNTPNAIVSFSTGVGFVPWLTDGNTVWSPPSYAFSAYDIHCGAVPFFPPYWSHTFRKSWRWYDDVTMGLLGQHYPATSYWTGTGDIDLQWEPEGWYGARLIPDAPWPGTVRLDRLRVSLKWRVEYVYTPAGPQA